MPKYTIHCSTSTSYYLTVEAPSLEATEKYYDACDGDEFLRSEEGGWRLDEICEDPLEWADIVIDTNGEKIKKDV